LQERGFCVILGVFRDLGIYPGSIVRVEIWPAIDIRGGKCVRLAQGDYRRETVFSRDPVAVARQWVEQGAKCLHLVDLDGAREGRAVNLPIVKAIAEAAGVPCEFGGGIRSEYAIQEAIKAGAQRIIIGTLALKEPAWFRRMCQKYPHRLVLGIDARDGLVATEGWLKTNQIPAVELAQLFTGEPIAAVIYTDIAADGMLGGPNVEAMAAMQRAVAWPVIASGGVTTKEDVARLAAVPMAGCIIGRALYEGTLTLPDALAATIPPPTIAPEKVPTADEPKKTKKQTAEKPAEEEGETGFVARKSPLAKLEPERKKSVKTASRRKATQEKNQPISKPRKARRKGGKG
jgi:phosphoribosylformimino-5-aminoimidazole carboxamide ribotide isomerase